MISIEASPATYARHVQGQINLAIEYPNACEVVPLNAAIGVRSRQGETVDFFFSETHPGRSTVNTALWEQWDKAVVYQSAIRVAVIEIDDLKALLGQKGTIDFIKLDLEGNEINALRGAVRTMATDRPAMVIELAAQAEQ